MPRHITRDESNLPGFGGEPLYAVWFDGGPDEADKMTVDEKVAQDWFSQSPETAKVYHIEGGKALDVTDVFWAFYHADEIAEEERVAAEEYTALRKAGLSHEQIGAL